MTDSTDLFDKVTVKMFENAAKERDELQVAALKFVIETSKYAIDKGDMELWKRVNEFSTICMKAMHDGIERLKEIHND